VLFNKGSAEPYGSTKHVVGFGVPHVFFASVCWCIIIQFFRSPFCIQTPSWSVVQKVECR